MKHPDLNKFLRKLYRKLKKKLLIRLFGYCYVHGHSWKMEKGWQSNPDWNPEESFRLTGNSFYGMAKDWIFYRCRRCKITGEKIKN